MCISILLLFKVDNYSATSMAVYKFISKKGYQGSYLTVNNFVKKHKKNEIKKATIRFETTPGLQAQVDWKESITFVNKNNEEYKVNIFLLVLGYSRLKFIKLTSNRNQKTLFECLTEAFKYINGIPKEILFDNMKTVVDRNETTFKNVSINKHFKSFSIDSGFEIVTCRAYRPQTKGKVETLAKLVNRLKVYNNEFETYEDIDKIIKEFNEDINNEIAQSIKEKPINRYLIEKEYLKPLPNLDILNSYFCQEKTYLVYPDSMINYKGKKYSVPTHLIGKQVNVSENNESINIYYMKDVIVSHLKSEKFLNYKTAHAINILKSDALSDYSNEEINTFVENRLSEMDIMLD